MRCQRNCTADAPVQAAGLSASGAEPSVRSTDPQSGDVTDGSVDYFDFEWGEPVFYDECTMEPVLFPCENSCEDPCHGDSCTCETEDETDCCCGCGDGEESGTDECAANMPDQNDSNLYEIIQE